MSDTPLTDAVMLASVSHVNDVLRSPEEPLTPLAKAAIDAVMKAVTALGEHAGNLERQLSGDFTLAHSPPWRCFHCGEFFTDARAAGIHFGIDQEFATPGCVERLTTSEQDLRRQVVASYEECSRAQDAAAKAERYEELYDALRADIRRLFNGADSLEIARDRMQCVENELKDAKAVITAAAAHSPTAVRLAREKVYGPEPA